mgnify:CR=1 FL=1
MFSAAKHSKELVVKVDKNVAIVYSPLNGTGLKPVLRTLKETGYTNITVVKEQENPDGNFPTCQYPNPEIKEAMALGMEYAKKCNADLLLATDPDCDRVGIAVKNAAGEYVLLSGNETGMLLLNYVCERRIAMGIMPKDPACAPSCGGVRCTPPRRSWAATRWRWGIIWTMPWRPFI